jgi:hypothetical protein
MGGRLVQLCERCVLLIMSRGMYLNNIDITALVDACSTWNFRARLERSRGESIPIHQLIADLGPSSTHAIPPEVKAKVIAMIQAAIESMLEK